MPKTAMPLLAIMAIIDLIDIGVIDVGGIVDGDFDVSSSRRRYDGANASDLPPRLSRADSQMPSAETLQAEKRTKDLG
jgi:hypothetical protein